MSEFKVRDLVICLHGNCDDVSCEANGGTVIGPACYGGGTGTHLEDVADPELRAKLREGLKARLHQALARLE